MGLHFVTDKHHNQLFINLFNNLVHQFIHAGKLPLRVYKQLHWKWVVSVCFHPCYRVSCKMHFSMVLFLVCSIAVRLSSAAIEVKATTTRCYSPAFLMYESMMTKFLEGYQTLTTIIGDDTVDNAIIEAIKCHRVNMLQASYKLYTVDTYFQSAERDRNDPTYGYNLNPYPLWEALYCEANVSMVMEEVLPAIAFRNPVARVVLLVRGIAKYDMLQFFRRAWTRYKMLDILILSRIDYQTLLVCLFNPYLTGRDEMADERNMLCYHLRTMEDVAQFNQKAQRFTFERINNLHHYQLQVAITDVELMSKAVYFQNGSIHRYQYLDGEMVEIFRQRMNFTIKYLELNYQESVGFISSNGSIGGSLKMLEENTIDLAANSRSIMQHPMRNLQYVHFLCPIRLVFVVPFNYFANRYKMVFFHAYSLQMYLTNIAMAVLIPSLLLVLMRRDFSVPAYVKESFRILAIVFACSVALPRNTRHRLVLMGLMFYSIVAYSAWQGITIVQLNQDDEKLRNIQTLEELADTDLDLKAIVTFGNAIRGKAWNGSDVRGRIAARLDVQWTPSNISIIPEVADNRTTAVPIIEYFVEVVRSRYFDSVRKRSKVYFIHEPFIEYLTAMALPKNSPLFPTIRRLTMSCLENGIVNFQLSLIRHKGVLLQIAQNRNRTLRDEPPARKVNLFNMRFVFYVYLVMNGGAILVFFFELAYHRHQKKRTTLRRNRRRVRARRSSIIWPYIE
uniref:Ionotropic glutamate receptor C-terminal domain-containing protein n=2 Tax=Anopheles coluzzii TaxID=1518534 RepID=A0A6E8WCA6_ANOCL